MNAALPPATAHLQCLSHTPLMTLLDPAEAVKRPVLDAIAGLRDSVARFAPDVVFLFAPDHYNGFFYDCMPQFCIGVQAASVGDFGSGQVALRVPRDIARACAQAVADAGVDIAVSYRMRVDHGFTQPLTLLTGAIDRLSVVPIFINSVASPLPTMRRARLLGEAVGGFARALAGKRVLFLGSGGLSHNPPIPDIQTAPPEVAERLIAGRNPTAAERAAREQRVVDAARAFASGQSGLHPLNPQWDRAFIDLLKKRDFAALDVMQNDAVTQAAGGSAHEVKTWVAANAAMDAATGGHYELTSSVYQDIPEWIAGFGVIEGKQQQAAGTAARPRP
jgi:2,3-dihydroxyphenylpropionate 1,2-dioxygenase